MAVLWMAKEGGRSFCSKRACFVLQLCKKLGVVKVPVCPLSTTQRIETKRHRVCLEVPADVVCKNDDEEKHFGKRPRLNLIPPRTPSQDIRRNKGILSWPFLDWSCKEAKLPIITWKTVSSNLVYRSPEVGGHTDQADVVGSISQKLHAKSRRSGPPSTLRQNSCSSHLSVPAQEWTPLGSSCADVDRHHHSACS